MATPMYDRKSFKRQSSLSYRASSDNDPRMDTFTGAVLSRSLSARYSVTPNELRSVNKLVAARLALARGEGRDIKELSPEIEEARSKLEEERQLRRIQSSRVQSDRNRAMKQRLHSACGRDAKALSPEVEAARAEAERRRLQGEKERQAFHQEHLQRMKKGIRAAGSHGRDAKALDPEVEEARFRAQQRRLAEKEDNQMRLAAHNHEMKSRIMKSQPRDVKSLSPEEEAARQRVQEEARRQRAMNKQRLKEDNARMNERLAKAGMKGRDAKELTAEEEAARAKLAAESQQAKAQYSRQLSANNSRQLQRVRSASSRVGSILTPEEQERREMHRMMLEEQKLQRQQEVCEEIVKLLQEQVVLGRGGKPQTVAGRWREAARFARLWNRGQEASIKEDEETSMEVLANRSI